MRYGHHTALIIGVLLVMAGSAHAQSSRPPAAALPLGFRSWQPAAPLDRPGPPAADRLVDGSRTRTRQALLGGTIGAAAGVVFCTTVSTLANDSAEGGLSFCPLDSYLLIGGAGFLLGAAIGWVM